MSEIAAIRAVVDGLVQGVGFRYWTVRQAQRLGIVGWVANLPGGAVEVHAQADPASLRAFTALLGDGPSHARVAGVTTRSATADPALSDFEIRV